VESCLHYELSLKMIVSSLFSGPIAASVVFVSSEYECVQVHKSKIHG
jgi:hypothetical protein